MFLVVGQPLGRKAHRRFVEWRLQLATPVSVDHRTRYEPQAGLQVSLFDLTSSTIDSASGGSDSAGL